MSSDYNIAGSLVMFPFVLITAPFVAAGFTMRENQEAYREEKERRKSLEEYRKEEQLRQYQNESYYSTMVEIYRSYKSAERNHEQKMEELDQRMESSLLEMYGSFTEHLKEASDMETLERRAKEGQEKLQRDWKRQREAFAGEFHSKLQTIFFGVRKNMERTHEGMKMLKEAAKDDPRKKEIAHQAANQAKAVLELLRLESHSPVEELEEGLKDAVQYYHQMDYEMSYSKSSAVILSCLQELEKVKCQQQAFFSLEGEILKELAVMEERISKMKCLEFPWKEDILEEDLFRFEPDLLEGVEHHVAELRQKLRSISGFRAEEMIVLKKLLEECRETDEDIISVGKYAAEKMMFAYSENENAEMITDCLEEQGFFLVDHAYVGGIEGNPLHVNFENEITGEKLTAVLTPTDKGTQISLHNYGRDGETAGNVKTQKAVQQVLENTFHHHGSCKGLGAVSSHTKEADLEAVKKAVPSKLPH